MMKLDMNFNIEVAFKYNTQTIELLRLPNNWCIGNEPNYALYNNSTKKWFVPSRRYFGGNRTLRSRPYWQMLPGRLYNINPSSTERSTEENEEAEAEAEAEEEAEEQDDDDDRTVEMEGGQGQDLENDSDPDDFHDATDFSYWYRQTSGLHNTVLEYLDKLNIAEGRKSRMDEWGIFKYE
jgi:hypothetical protein